MNSLSAQPIMPLPLSEKEIKSQGVQLIVWLWPQTEKELWPQKLACGKTLADLTLRLPSVQVEATPFIDNWAMIVAMMLNGTKHIYGDPDPFTIDRGKSPELQAWRLLVIRSLALLPADGYLMCDVASMALNTIDSSFNPALNTNRFLENYGTDIVRYLKHQGHGNGITWFRALDIKAQHGALLEQIPAALRILKQSLDCFTAHLPQTSVLASRMTRQKYHLQILINAVPKMVPLALEELAKLLKPLQSSTPAAADKPLGEQAAAHYQFKNMLPNTARITEIDAPSIENLLAYYATSKPQQDTNSST